MHRVAGVVTGLLGGLDVGLETSRRDLVDRFLVDLVPVLVRLGILGERGPVRRCVGITLVEYLLLVLGVAAIPSAVTDDVVQLLWHLALVNRPGRVCVTAVL